MSFPSFNLEGSYTRNLSSLTGCRKSIQNHKMSWSGCSLKSRLYTTNSSYFLRNTERSCWVKHRSWKNWRCRWGNLLADLNMDLNPVTGPCFTSVCNMHTLGLDLFQVSWNLLNLNSVSSLEWLWHEIIVLLLSRIFQILLSCTTLIARPSVWASVSVLACCPVMRRITCPGDYLVIICFSSLWQLSSS